MLRTRIIIIIVIITAVITGVVGVLFPPIDGSPPSAVEAPEAAPRDGAQLPTPAAPAEGGQVAGLARFMEFCGKCHGGQALGTNQGPPLVHQIYESNHHADGAFVLAARRGSPQHHWNFGNMPPVPRVSDGDLFAIIGYVRTLQQAAGIF